MKDGPAQRPSYRPEESADRHETLDVTRRQFVDGQIARIVASSINRYAPAEWPITMMRSGSPALLDVALHPGERRCGILDVGWMGYLRGQAIADHDGQVAFRREPAAYKTLLGPVAGGQRAAVDRQDDGCVRCALRYVQVEPILASRSAQRWERNRCP